ncbi:helix-turn-helix domain-containing protein [Pseudomonas sp. F1_0610]|uniref:AraC family transcriptional regulator n=1 Tax=Pseudomonas sp. F1_0610 TaxID=3114284 RepID=UPI0039C2F364
MLSFYKSFTYEKHMSVTAHSHIEQQWVYMHEGLGVVRTPSQSIFISHGQLLKIPARFAHEFEVMRTGRVSVFYATPASEDGILAQQTVSTLLVQLLELFQQESDPKLRDAYAQVIYPQLLQQQNVAFNTYVTNRLDRRLLKAMEVVSSRPNIQLTLNHAADHAGVSIRTLHRLFLQGLGCSFRQWRTHIVMQEAVILQKQGLNQTQIAYELGYDSLSAFSAAFSNYQKNQLAPA